MSAKDFIPRHAPGHRPGGDFVDGGFPEGTRIGIITRVDEINLKADVNIITGGAERTELDLTQAMAGPRSFGGGVPEEGSLVIIGYRKKHKQLHEAVILGYLPVGNRTGLKFDPFAPTDPAEVDPNDEPHFTAMMGPTRRHKRLKLRSGDVGGMSSGGSELVLSKDLRMTNRAGDMLELRDAERTLVTSSVHRVQSESGVKFISGPVRRGGFFLPQDVFQADGVTLKAEADRYFGRDELQALGPGLTGSPTKFSNSTGVISRLFNNQSGEFPPVTYSSGKRVFYAATMPATSIENVDAGSPDAFTEHRTELAHQTDLQQDVLGEIDGFEMSPSSVYIEQVLGTVVGNDLKDALGQRQYGKVLKPRVFDDFSQTKKGNFVLDEVSRSPINNDLEVLTSAAAYLLRIRPPYSSADEFPFAVSVQKQGKLVAQIPKSQFERYPDGTKGISAELNLEGALKMFIGAATPNNVSLFLKCDGGIVADIGHLANGAAIDVTYRSSVSTTYVGSQDDNDLAFSQDIRGNAAVACAGDIAETVEGSRSTLVNGLCSINSDRLNLNSHSGYSGNFGELNVLVSGKSQYNYAQQLTENIISGGQIRTILAGAFSQTVTAGAVSFDALAGATSFNNPAGAYSVTVGNGALSLTTSSGAMSLSAAAGAVSINAGGAMSLVASLAVTISSSVMVSLAAPQVALGGPAAAFGVCRGLPLLPPGTPTLDPITGSPLFGSAMVRSI